jgi:hypothetical protein
MLLHLVVVVASTTLTRVRQPHLTPTTTLIATMSMEIVVNADEAMVVVMAMAKVHGCSIHGPTSRHVPITNSTNWPWRHHGSHAGMLLRQRLGPSTCSSVLPGLHCNRLPTSSQQCYDGPSSTAVATARSSASYSSSEHAAPWQSRVGYGFWRLDPYGIRPCYTLLSSSLLISPYHRR